MYFLRKALERAKRDRKVRLTFADAWLEAAREPRMPNEHKVLLVEAAVRMLDLVRDEAVASLAVLKALVGAKDEVGEAPMAEVIELKAKKNMTEEEP